MSHHSLSAISSPPNSVNVVDPPCCLPLACNCQPRFNDPAFHAVGRYLFAISAGIKISPKFFRLEPISANTISLEDNEVLPIAPSLVDAVDVGISMLSSIRTAMTDLSGVDESVVRNRWDELSASSPSFTTTSSLSPVRPKHLKKATSQVSGNPAVPSSNAPQNTPSVPSIRRSSRPTGTSKGKSTPARSVVQPTPARSVVQPTPARSVVQPTPVPAATAMQPKPARSIAKLTPVVELPASTATPSKRTLLSSANTVRTFRRAMSPSLPQPAPLLSLPPPTSAVFETKPKRRKIYGDEGCIFWYTSGGLHAIGDPPLVPSDHKVASGDFYVHVVTDHGIQIWQVCQMDENGNPEWEVMQEGDVETFGGREYSLTYNVDGHILNWITQGTVGRKERRVKRKDKP